MYKYVCIYTYITYIDVEFTRFVPFVCPGFKLEAMILASTQQIYLYTKTGFTIIKFKPYKHLLPLTRFVPLVCPGFKLQAMILAHLFLAVESGAITSPLWPQVYIYTYMYMYIYIYIYIYIYVYASGPTLNPSAP